MNTVTNKIKSVKHNNNKDCKENKVDNNEFLELDTYLMYFFALIVLVYHKVISPNIKLNPTLHGGGAMMAPPSNFGASQLQHEGLVWSNLHMNLVTWVPTMTKTPKKFQKFNGV